MSAEPLVFTDTNFLVYALTDGLNDLRHTKARVRFKELLEQNRLCLSTQVLQELFVTLTRKHGQSVRRALSVIEDLAEYPLFLVDRSAICVAARLCGDSKISFWDALIVVSASRMGAEVLLTEDLNHGQRIGSVRVDNPFLTD